MLLCMLVLHFSHERNSDTPSTALTTNHVVTLSMEGVTGHCSKRPGDRGSSNVHPPAAGAVLLVIRCQLVSNMTLKPPLVISWDIIYYVCHVTQMRAIVIKANVFGLHCAPLYTRWLNAGKLLLGHWLPSRPVHVQEKAVDWGRFVRWLAAKSWERGMVCRLAGYGPLAGYGTQIKSVLCRSESDWARFDQW